MNQKTFDAFVRACEAQSAQIGNAEAMADFGLALAQDVERVARLLDSADRVAFALHVGWITGSFTAAACYTPGAAETWVRGMLDSLRRLTSPLLSVPQQAAFDFVRPPPKAAIGLAATALTPNRED